MTLRDDIADDVAEVFMDLDGLAQEIVHRSSRDADGTTIAAVVAIDPGDLQLDENGRRMSRRIRVAAASDGFAPTKASHFEFNGLLYATDHIDGDEFVTVVSCVFADRLDKGAARR